MAHIAAAYVHTILEGPLRVDILAVLPRPQRLRRKKDPDALAWCPKRPDQDNIRKAVLDGLKSCWIDDAQVCAGETFKCYAEKTGKPRTVVRISPLTDADMPNGRFV